MGLVLAPRLQSGPVPARPRLARPPAEGVNVDFYRQLDPTKAAVDRLAA